MRLSGIGSGSTKLFITGQNAPDLFGNSLLEEALVESFELLLADSPEKLANRVNRLGKKTASSIDKFLRTITSNELEVDVSWHSPSEKSYKWEGKTENIQRLSQSLERLTEQEPEEVRFSGEIVTLSTRGNFEIYDDTEITYKGTFPKELLPKIQESHVGQRCGGIILKKKLTNQITGYEKIFYELKDLKI